MNILLETERLILRRFVEDDVDNLFELNSDPDVVRFTPDKPVERSIIQTEILPRFFALYEKYNGYGIWAVVEKSSQEFIGWFLFRPVVNARYFDVSPWFTVRIIGILIFCIMTSLVLSTRLFTSRCQK